MFLGRGKVELSHDNQDPIVKNGQVMFASSSFLSENSNVEFSGYTPGRATSSFAGLNTELNQTRPSRSKNGLGRAFRIPAATSTRIDVPSSDFTEAFNNDKTKARVTGNQVSVSAWVWAKDTSANQVFVAKISHPAFHTSPFFSYALAMIAPSSLRFWTATASGNKWADGGTFKFEQWNHVAGVYNGTDIYTYLNGSQVATNTQSGNLNDYAFGLGVGNNGGGNESFVGDIHDVCVWERPLTQAEIAHLAKQTSRWNPTQFVASSGNPRLGDYHVGGLPW